MYKLKLRKGEHMTVTVKGAKIKLQGGEEHPQELLQLLYEDGLRAIVTKIKDKE